MATELSVPKGHGLVRVAHNLRVHVPAYLWQSVAGTDFWYVVNHADAITAAGATNPSGLSGWGWTTTTLSLSSATGGGFLDSSDVGTPTATVFGDDTDFLQSPIIFGAYSHGLMTGQILGRLPTRLICEIYAAFTTSSGSETRSGFGLTEAGGASGTADDALAWIHVPDGTNFGLRSGVDSDAGSTVDSNYHQFRIVISKGTTDKIEWFIDGTSQGTIDLQENLAPFSFGGYASTANRLALAWAHLWYE